MDTGTNISESKSFVWKVFLVRLPWTSKHTYNIAAAWEFGCKPIGSTTTITSHKMPPDPTYCVCSNYFALACSMLKSNLGRFIYHHCCYSFVWQHLLVYCMTNCFPPCNELAHLAQVTYRIKTFAQLKQSVRAWSSTEKCQYLLWGEHGIAIKHVNGQESYYILLFFFFHFLFFTSITCSW